MCFWHLYQKLDDCSWVALYLGPQLYFVNLCVDPCCFYHYDSTVYLETRYGDTSSDICFLRIPLTEVFCAFKWILRFFPPNFCEELRQHFDVNCLESIDCFCCDGCFYNINPANRSAQEIFLPPSVFSSPFCWWLKFFRSVIISINFYRNLSYLG